MYKITSAILLSCLIAGLFSNPASAEENFMLTITSFPEFEKGTHSTINGKTITLDEKPVSNVIIHVYFPSAIIKTTTNATGQFTATSPIPVEIGEYNITVYAKKDNKYTNTSITYQGIESKPVQEIKKPAKNADGTIEIDPFSKMIQELEKQKTQEVNRQETNNEQYQIDEQRLISKQLLEKDLREAEKKNESHSPRNAFYKFIQEIDSSVRGIFWQQFLFTENITQQALDAKELALNEGKSSYEATKIFQKKAAVTQQEVIEFNKNLNIGYGNATSDIQNLFDKEGKLPREN